MADGFTVDRAALLETAQGLLSDPIKALGKLGFAEEADIGRGFRVELKRPAGERCGPAGGVRQVL